MYHATIGKLSLIINLMTCPKGSGYLSVLGILMFPEAEPKMPFDIYC